MAETEAAPAAASTPAAPVAVPVYMDYQSGHAELTRSLSQSFLEGPGEGIRLLEQSCESLVSQDGENKKLVLDQVPFCSDWTELKLRIRIIIWLASSLVE
jgi:hypothetical protein